MSEIYRPGRDRPNLILDLSAGLTLGPVPGLENIQNAAAPLLHLVDGIIVSPGQTRLFLHLTQKDAAILVKADWTNALRSPEFPLPPETINYIPLIDPSDGLDLGASGLVTTFLLGFEEMIEAACLRNAVQMALQGRPLGLPLLVDVQPFGPRVVLKGKAIALGASYALESGADGLAIPWPGVEVLKDILTMAAGTPVWIKLFANLPAPITIEAVTALAAQTNEFEVAGYWLDERLFSLDALALLSELAESRTGDSLPVSASRAQQ